MSDVFSMLEEISKKGKSAKINLRRKIFNDPLLTVYVIEGKPILAHSFLVRNPWYEDINQYFSRSEH